LGENGDVLMKSSQQIGSNKEYKVVIFDPLVEAAIDDLCVEIFEGEYECDYSNIDSFSKSKSPNKIRRIVYSDGTSQIIKPTLLSPDIFIKELTKFDGIEKIIYNADGTFFVRYYGNSYIITPSFNVKNKTVEQEVDPSISYNENGTIQYNIAIEVDVDDTRRTTRSSESYEVLTFDSSVEETDSDSCIEISDGEYYCDDDSE